MLVLCKRERSSSIPMEICPAHCICDLRYAVPREIPVILHNGSNFNFHLKWNIFLKNSKKKKNSFV